MLLTFSGAVVPVDPCAPDARVRYILDDSGARVAIATKVLPNMEELLCLSAKEGNCHCRLASMYRESARILPHTALVCKTAGSSPFLYFGHA